MRKAAPKRIARHALTDNQISEICRAISRIASGSTSGPDGLELVGMALAGEGQPGFSSVAGSLESIAQSIDGLAEAIREAREK